MKILNFGSCNIDFVYSLNHIVAVGETEQSSSMNIFPGGKGLNQSIALSRAGADIFHAGCIGQDGQMLSTLMSDNGIDISHIKTVDMRTGHAIIQVSVKGENSIFVFPGANSTITESFIVSVLDNFESGDIILLQNEINGINTIMNKAAEKDMCIVFNPSPCNSDIKDLPFEKISYLILNEVEAEILSGYSEPEQSLKYFIDKYPNIKIVLTLGKKGAVYCDKSTKIFQPAFRVNTVDTTAAGDTFTGYFIASIAEGSEYDKALKIASAASAISVSRQGAAPSVPQKSEVISFLDSAAEYCSFDKFEHIKSTTEQYINKHLKDSSINELAEILGYSVAYTQSLIKKSYNMPLSKLTQDKCCHFAMNMLKETDLPISEIINRLGYENESFFRRIFKEKYGKNMSDIRKSNIK